MSLFEQMALLLNGHVHIAAVNNDVQLLEKDVKRFIMTVCCDIPVLKWGPDRNNVLL